MVGDQVLVALPRDLASGGKVEQRLAAFGPFSIIAVDDARSLLTCRFDVDDDASFDIVVHARSARRYEPPLPLADDTSLFAVENADRPRTAAARIAEHPELGFARAPKSVQRLARDAVQRAAARRRLLGGVGVGVASADEVDSLLAAPAAAVGQDRAQPTPTVASIIGRDDSRSFPATSVAGDVSVLRVVEREQEAEFVGSSSASGSRIAADEQDGSKIATSTSSEASLG